MPQLIFAPAALRDLERLRAFLLPKNPAAAKRAAAAIIPTIQTLATHPDMGRPTGNLDERELLIDFGATAMWRSTDTMAAWLLSWPSGMDEKPASPRSYMPVSGPPRLWE